MKLTRLELLYLTDALEHYQEGVADGSIQPYGELKEDGLRLLLNMSLFFKISEEVENVIQGDE